MNKNINIVFFGTSDFSARILESILLDKHKVSLIVTQPDKKVGRKREISCSAVKTIAVKRNIKIIQPDKLKKDFIERELRSLNPDLFVVASYGNILPKALLDIPRFGSINVHASLLPKYRGASPVQSAILSGEKKTGVTLMLMNEKMDEGDILASQKVAIEETDTAESMLEKLGALGAKTLIEFLPDWVAGKTKPMPQNENEATYCRPIKRESGKINWEDSAEEIFRKWRAYQPWPGLFAHFRVKNQLKRLKFLAITIDKIAVSGEKPGKVVEYNQQTAVQTGGGLVILREVQLEGKKVMSAADFAKGHNNFVGSQLE